jgi:hypothetical protein
MAYTEGLCSKLQANLVDIAGYNAPALNRQKVGFIDALMSDINRINIRTEIVPTNGKFRAVQINYQSQACDDDVSTDPTPNCTTSLAPAPSEALITSFDVAKYKMKFAENDMRKLCEADSVWVGQNIMRAMNAVNMKVDKLILATQAANMGTFADGSVSKDIPLFNSTTQGPNAMAWAGIRHYYDELGAASTPLIVGGGSIDLYAKAQQIACCNSTVGMDLARMTGDGYFYNDVNVNSVFDPTQFIVLAPGAVQLVTWNKYLGDYAKRSDSFEHGTIVDPFTGLVYDLKTSYDDCTESWYVELALNYNLFQVPAAFCVDAGVNMSLLFEDCSTSPIGCGG